MPTLNSMQPTKTFRLSEQGFDVFALRNEAVEIALVPELGAKIISLRNLATGCEWMWHPPAGRKLFRNRLGDDFATSPMTGWDECLPTIAPCDWKGRKLPDHGEVWSVPWEIDLNAFQRGVLNTSVTLAVSPFHFERRIELCGDEVRLDYRLENRGNHTLGIWLTRDGWNGYHHIALEPANGAADILTAAVKAGHGGLLAPKEKQSWQVKLRIGL